jgi:serine/threonine protein phosphatase PrpC
MNAAALSDVGRIRKRNEDAVAVLPDQGLFIVADGMGGHNAGAVASKIVVEALPQMIQKRLRGVASEDTEGMSILLRDTVLDLSRRVWREATSRPELTGMGATVVAACVRGRRVFIVHMGDSRAYLFKEEKLRQLTEDHSVIGILLRHGEITREEAEHHPARARVSRCVGMQAEVYPDVQSLCLAQGERLLLCTDGLTGTVSDAAIGEVLRESRDPESACRALVDAANAAGGQDNTTVLVADWREIEDAVGH